LQLRFFGSCEPETDPSNAFERDGVFLFIHIFAVHCLQFVKVESIRRSRAVSSTVVTCPLRWG